MDRNVGICRNCGMPMVAMSFFVGICRSSDLCFAAWLTTIEPFFNHNDEYSMATHSDPGTEKLLQENAQLMAQTQSISEQLRLLMANPVRQKLRELGVQDEEAFYAWLEKQVDPMDWAQVERQAQEQLTLLLAPPTLEQPSAGGRARRHRQLV